MKRLRKWYSDFKWRDRILTLVFVQAVFLAISFQLKYDLIITGLVVTGILGTIHFLLAKAKFPIPAIVMLLQTAALSVSFIAYAILGQPLFGQGSYMFSAFLLTAATALIFIIGFKYSVGRLWLTLLVSYIALDALGPMIMQILHSNNPFVGISAGFAVLAIRCVLWRDIFRNRKAEIPEGIKKKENTASLKSLLESMENVEVKEVKDSAIDFSVETPVNTYYINSIALRQRIVVTNEDIASGNYNLKSTLFETARKTFALNKGTKRKSRKNPVACIVNTNDKSNSKARMNVSITGKTRDSGKDVLILSPSSLVSLVKKDLVGTN
jgi:hypothetical protein